MLRLITRNKQLTIPKEFIDRLHLHEDDYVSIDCDDDSIRLRAVVIDELSSKDYKKLAYKLDQLKKRTWQTLQGFRNYSQALKTSDDIKYNTNLMQPLIAGY